MLKVSVVTLGCKVNQYESNAMLEILEKSGYKKAENVKDSNIIIVNSCTVTARSDQKLLRAINKLKKESPEAIMILSGCMPQAFPKIAENINGIDILIGNSNRKDIKNVVEKFLQNRQKIMHIKPHSSFENLKTSSFCERSRAFLKIEDGCNNFCSFCIIPYSRGRVRCKKLSDVIKEAESLANSCYKEIVLTGINLSAYNDDGKDLADVVLEISKIKRIKRIRLSSLEPNIIDKDFLNKIKSTEKFCSSFHLSMQSGCDKTLKDMNRKYTTKEYEAAVNLIRSKFEDASVSTDILLGFPGETVEDFCKTKAFVEKIKFSRAHIFKFSKREGTFAAKLKDDVEPFEKSLRSKIIKEVVKKSSKEFLNSQVLKTKPVLFENKTKDGFFGGYTNNYIRVKVKSKENLSGKIVDLKIEKAYIENIKF